MQEHKYGIFFAILVILALIALVYMTMRARLYMHAQESVKESFAQKGSASHKMLVPQAVWPKVPWKATILKDPKSLHQQVVFGMEENTLSQSQTEYHENHDHGMRFKTPVDVTFHRARIDADREGTIAFRISKWIESGEPFGDTVAEKEIYVQKGEQWIDLGLSVEGDADKSFVIWYPQNDIKSEVSLKRTREDNAYANAKIGPVQFMGGTSPQGDENKKWFYLFQLELAVPIYSFFDKDVQTGAKDMLQDQEKNEDEQNESEIFDPVSSPVSMPRQIQGQMEGFWIRNTDWPHADIVKLRRYNTQQCVDACKSNPQCGAVSNNTRAYECWLKDKNKLKQISQNEIHTSLRDLWIKDKQYM